MDDKRFFRATCQECGVNEADYTVSIMREGKLCLCHLCSECMEKLNINVPTGGVTTLLGSLIAAIAGEAASLMPRGAAAGLEKVPVCSRCETSLSDFVRGGFLGCPACYNAFHDHVEKLLLERNGSLMHTGRRPCHADEARRRMAAYDELVTSMEWAAANEDYETAARLRDQIRAMEEGDQA